MSETNQENLKTEEQKFDFVDTLLRERKKKRWSIKKVAKLLNLDSSVIQAIESRDFSRIPSVFICGYIRNYAGILDLEAQPLIEDYQLNHQKLPDLHRAQFVENIASPSIGKKILPLSSFIPVFILALILIITAVFYSDITKLIKNIGRIESSVYNNDNLENESLQLPDKSLQLPDQSLQLADKSLQLQDNLEQADNKLQLPEIKHQPVRQNKSEDKTDNEQTNIENNPASIDTQDEMVSTIVSQQNEQLLISKKQDLIDTNKNKQVLETSSNVSQQESAEKKSKISKIKEASSENVADTEQTSGLKKVLELEFQQACWTKIVDAENKRLLFGLIKKNSHYRLKATPPVTIFLGNAIGVSLLVDDVPYVLEPHISADNIARITIE